MTLILTDETLVAMPDTQWATLEVKLRRWWGFEPGDVVGDVSDKPPQGLVCLTRVNQGQHQYVSLCYTPTRDRFLEAVVLIYEKPLDTRAKKRQIPLFATIVRGGLEDILAVVNRVYVHLFTPPHP